MYKRLALNGLAVIGILAGASAYAEQGPGFYLGAGVSQASVKIDDVDFNDSDNGFKVLIGYNFNKNFGAEVTYFDGGAPSENYDVGFGPPVKVEVAFTGANVSLVGKIPVNETFGVFGKVGYASYKAKVTGSSGGFSSSESVDDEDVSYGGGLSLSFGQFDLLGEYEAINIDGGDFHTISLTGIYRF